MRDYRAVLTFHSIDDSGSVLSFPIRAFAALIEQFVSSGTPIVTFDELQTIPHGVTLTFDDGMASVARNALPVLRDAKAPSHLFLTTGRVGLDNHWRSQPPGAPACKLTDWTDIENCVSAGMYVENHTVNHPDLRALNRTEMIDECAVADEMIERRLGRRPRLFAYPYGWFNDTAREVAAERYAAAFTTQLDYFDNAMDSHRIPRIDTYYLREPAVARQLLRPAGRAYIAARSFLRTLRGTQ